MNNSPNSIDFIWMHLWPNAYKDNNTAFAKQMWENGRSKFYFSDEDDRGYIDSLNFTIKGVPLQVEAHPEWIDVVKLILPAPLAPGKRITIETPFKVKIPIVFSRLGHSGKHYEITQWYPKPAVYDMDGWHPMPYLNMGEFYSEFGTFDVKITIPEKYVVMGTGTILNGESEYAWLDSLAEEGNKLTLMPKSEIKKNSKKIKKEIAKRNKEEKKKEKRKKRAKIWTLVEPRNSSWDFCVSFSVLEFGRAAFLIRSTIGSTPIPARITLISAAFSTFFIFLL